MGEVKGVFTQLSSTVVRSVVRSIVVIAFVAFLCVSAAPAEAETYSRANTTADGAQSVGPASRGTISDDGTLVAFHSPSGDLVPNDTNGVADVFVKDLTSGSITRVSTDFAGNQANNRSTFAQISPDKKYVVFQSLASNLVPNDTNGKTDIFMKSLITGEISRISVASDGSQANGDSRFPQIGMDSTGQPRYVVFQSDSSNLVSGDSNRSWDVFIRDLQLQTTERISVSSTGGQGNNFSVRPTIGGAGCKIVFHSWATNLVGNDTNGKADVFLRDRCARNTSRISTSSTGGQGNGDSQFGRISASGNVVVFHSTASNLVSADTNRVRDTFVKILATGVTERVSVSSAGLEADGATGFGYPSADGSYIYFHGTASNLDPVDTNGLQDVFVRDRNVHTTRLVSATTDTTNPSANGISGSPYCSRDGSIVVFQSQASNLVSGDTNNAQDVFVRRRP